MKIDFLIPTEEQTHPIPLALELAGRIADEGARRRVFADYHERRAQNTLDQQRANLEALRAWLTETAADPGDLFVDPEAWRGLTWGLCADFIRAQLAGGMAVATVNHRLSTIKRYSALALQAGTLAHDQYAMIRAITGYSQKEARNLDTKRTGAGLATRTGAKAAEPILLDPDQVQLLKTQHEDTPQGRRDRLMVCLFLELGLRCGELAGLRAAGLQLAAGQLTFYRAKVGKQQTHNLPPASLQAARSYMKRDGIDPAGPLILASHKSGQLVAQGMGERTVSARIRLLGQKLLGLGGLSPHDLRHSWATNAARAGADPFSLQEAGGWASLAMPRRYVEAARIANAGLKWE